MPKLKLIPCMRCKQSLQCMEFLVERAKEYEKDSDLCEDYNSESLWNMGTNCTKLNDFLLLEEISFPSRNYHFSWWPQMESKISQMAWIGRLNRLIDYYHNILIPGSM